MSVFTFQTDILFRNKINNKQHKLLQRIFSIKDRVYGPNGDKSKRRQT